MALQAWRNLSPRARREAREGYLGILPWAIGFVAFTAGPLLALLDDLAGTYAIDQRRVYLTGLSLGARGAWRLAANTPARFAALAPICGRRPDGMRNTEDVQALREIPTWVFHGALDEVVPIEESDIIVAALRAHGASVRYTVYPAAGHDSWTSAYAEPELYTWMLSQHR
jgi:predicted peptidase